MDYVRNLNEVDQAWATLVGGKGAALGELSQVEGACVPAGFCVTTHAFHQAVRAQPSIGGRVDRLSRLKPDDEHTIRAITGELRSTIEAAPVPEQLEAAIARVLTQFGDTAAYAVRSSATAEDLPRASFAGKQDSYLNITGPDAILRHVRKCWASLFSERAVAYRLRNGFDHHTVDMAVVVQRMVFPSSSGIMFTADPITSNRKITAVEASFGLGEAEVAGSVNTDSYTIQDGEITAETTAVKSHTVHALPEGGTQERAVDPGLRAQPALTDGQVVRLAQLGRRVEAHFGRPQDIEWCLADEQFHIVQARPITTLFPVPVTDDQQHHIYVSVGHQQMMTDAMKPLGLSLWQLTTPQPMHEAGSRLFVDIAPALASSEGQQGLLRTLGTSDPLLGDALRTLIERDGPGQEHHVAESPDRHVGDSDDMVDADPTVVTDLMLGTETSIAVLRRDIRTKSGVELLDFILADTEEMRRILHNSQQTQVIMTAMNAAQWLNEQLHVWLGEQNAADTLTQSVSHNVTSDMGLALLDVADAFRPHPEVLAYLRRVESGELHGDEDTLLDELATFEGGSDAREALRAFLDTYGMRCTGEIDITNPRWRERPTTLIPMILGNIDNFDPGASERIFDNGRQNAWHAEQDFLRRLRTLPQGDRKATETKRMIDRVRTYTGYREYPKYGMISRYFVYKKALLAEAERLERDHVLEDQEDIFYLRFPELREVVRTRQSCATLISERKEEFESHQALTPPRLFTSDGEVIPGAYQRDNVPTDALAGLAVSAGTVEGRARIIDDMAHAHLAPDDILITRYTDPSWAPLFVTIRGLVTEVGGLMTHGAVVAREYGLPAVVSVAGATRKIRDGQRIRVHGTDGYIVILAHT